MSDNRIICPTAEDLNDVQTNLYCSVTGCNKTFRCTPSRSLHLKTVHRVLEPECVQPRIEEGKNVHYYCPDVGCKYHYKDDRSLYFTSRSSLRYHYLRCHGKKKFICSGCGYKYALERDLRRHKKQCRGELDCSTCHIRYPSRQALLDHCEAEKHVPQIANPGNIDSMTSQSVDKRVQKQKCACGNSQSPSPVTQPMPTTVIINISMTSPPGQKQSAPVPGLRALAPKPTVMTASTATERSVKADACVQTVTRRSASGAGRRRQTPSLTTGTQTSARIRRLLKTAVHRQTTGAQTTADYVMRSRRRSVEVTSTRTQSRYSQVSPRARATCRHDDGQASTSQWTAGRPAPQMTSQTPFAASSKRQVQKQNVQTYTTGNLYLLNECQTQTSSLFDDLEDLGLLQESNSTQTAESYLSSNQPPSVTGGVSASPPPAPSAARAAAASQTPALPVLSVDTSYPDMIFGPDLQPSSDLLLSPEFTDNTAQTLEPFADIALDPDPDYMHMETQTAILDDMFFNIQTQTAAEDHSDSLALFGLINMSQDNFDLAPSNSAETQTTESLAHRETQTSLRFATSVVNLVTSQDMTTQTRFPESL